MIQETEEEHWIYNATDCVITRECGEVLLETTRKMGLEGVDAFQQSLFHPVLQAMIRGVRVRQDIRNQLTMECQEELSLRESFVQKVLGHGLNPGSSPQMTKLFYEDLKQPPNWKRKAIGPSSLTCDDDALQKIAQREPLLRPLINAIGDIRTLGVFLSTFLLAKLDVDGRMRCSYNIGGNAQGKSAPYSYRLSSAKNAFDSGMNLQNLPSEKSKALGKAAKRSDTDFQLPNIRTMFGPDSGFTFFDLDLDRADLQVVVWEMDDEMLKTALKKGADIHLLNAFVLDGKEPPPMEELDESHPRYQDHRGRFKMQREFAKVFVHGSNYGGSARTMASHVGITVHAAERAQRIWFGAHPKIKQWHERTKQQVLKHRFVENKFGYRWYIFDRLDSVFNDALAWVPQSTVACVINRAWVNIYKNIPETQVLLQVHDSLAGQFPTHRKVEMLTRIEKECKIVIPYDDPLIIPVGIKTSEVSWGDVA